MQKLHILNSKDKKHIVSAIKDQWGCDFKTDLVLLKSSKDRIYLITRDLERLNTSMIRVDSMGMYFATLAKEGIRLSIEGSQMIGPIATKNVLEVDHETMRLWLKGNDLELEEERANTFVILKNKEDFLGCGKVKDGQVLSFVPKNRRILAKD